MEGEGPLTSFLRDHFGCPHELAKVARLLKTDVEELLTFEATYADLVRMYGDGVTPMHFVASSDRMDLLKALVKEGWGVDDECGPIGTPLCVALDLGCISVARKFIELGADTTRFTWLGKTPMFYALTNNKKSKTIISALKVLCDAGVSLDAPCQREGKARPIHIAALNNSPKIVSFLLQMGADANIKDAYDSMAIHYAAANNRVEIIALLMKHRVKLDKKDCHGFTPLAIALRGEKVETVAAFVENGLKINGYKHTENLTLLHMAVTVPKFEIVEYLVKSGADPNAKSATKPHLHPLQLLATQPDYLPGERKKFSLERLKVLDYLVENGANVTCSEKCEESPLYLSMKEGFLKFAKAIIGHGANVNGRLPSGEYLFHLAVKTNNSIIFRFLEFGGDYNVDNLLGLTPYHLAIQKKVDLKYIKSFIGTGCPYNQKKTVWADILKRVNSQEIKKFFEAQRIFFKGLQDNSLELLVKTSVENGAIPTACSEEMRHPLHFVVSKGYESLVAFLLEHNFPPNCLNNNGETPLQIAARKGHLIISSLLLKHGACYNFTSKKSPKTPAKLAEESKNENVTNLFQQVARMFHLAKKRPKVMLRELSNATDEDYLMFVNARNSSGHTLASSLLQNEKNSVHLTAMVALRLKCEL